VEVGAGDAACSAYLAKEGAGLDQLTGFYIDLGEMAVEGVHA